MEPFANYITIYTLPKLFLKNNLQFSLESKADLVLQTEWTSFISKREYFTYMMAQIISCKLKKMENIIPNSSTNSEGELIGLFDDALDSFSAPSGSTLSELLQILFSLVKVSDIFKHLHAKNVIHFDIKTSNLLIKKIRINDSEIIHQVEISDFDISSNIEKTEIVSYIKSEIPFYYFAPELRNRQENTELNDRSLDIYSFES